MKPTPLERTQCLEQLRAQEVTRRAEYLDTAKRVLAALGGEVKTLLLDEPDTTPTKKIAEPVFYLRAYGQVVPPPQEKSGDRR